MFIKICGLTTLEDARAAVAAGADAVGFVFAPSPRRITPMEARTISAALPKEVRRVGVFVSPAPAEVKAVMAQAGLDFLQIHGEYPPDQLAELTGRFIQCIRVGMDKPHPGLVRGQPRYLLLDAHQPGRFGGTGTAFAWSAAADYKYLGIPLLVAGGLHPGNVRAALAATLPAGVDVSSGVESAPGRKDPRLMAAFVAAVREWEAKEYNDDAK